jgi:thymidylate synthase ThyX
MLAGYEVTMIADSVPDANNNFYVKKSWQGDYRKKDGELGLSAERLSTIVARFPRPVLAEVNTHRVFSRNSASSRARSIKTTIRDVMETPYIPLFTNNQKGMGGEYVTAEVREQAIEAWLQARDSAVSHVLTLLLGGLIPEGTHSEIAKNYSALVDLYYAEVYNAEVPNEVALSIHKQNVNRLLEPFSWHEAVITSSYWDNFLDLRNHDEAQPEIHAMAALVDAVLRASNPDKTWIHLPFIAPEDFPKNDRDFTGIYDVSLRSATECAQISFRDKSNAVKTTATSALGKRLFASKHFSPFEHVAFSTDSTQFIKTNIEKAPLSVLVSNLDKSWTQLRPVLVNL